MASETITVIKPGLTTTSTTAGASATTAGDAFANDGVTILRFTNTGSEVTATINSQVNCSQGSDHDVTVVIPATTGDVVKGPFAKARFDDANELVQITYGTTPTSVKVWALSAGGT